MATALLSDLHANRQALEACLAHARAQGVVRFALLGDLVGYGADPAAVVTCCMALADAGAVVLQGNHDEMAVSPPPAADTLGSSTAAWTHAQLSREQREFLAGLPLTAVRGHSLYVHASAHAPERWLYVDEPGAAQRCLDAAQALGDMRHVHVGHVHQQTLYYPGAGQRLMRFVPTPGVAVPLPAHRRSVCTVGSVGQPRDGDPRAMYAIVDPHRHRVVFHRVPYDHHAAAQAIRRAGLPDFFAERLELGR